MADLYQALAEITSQRKSIRKFSAEPVPEDYIEKILKTAQTSPYASGRKNWGIEVIRDKKIIDEAVTLVKNRSWKIADNTKEEFRGEFLRYAKSFYSFEGAPLLFVPYFRFAPTLSLMLQDPDESISLWERDNFTKSISCVALLIILAAESLGLASCYITGALIAEEELGRIFNIKTGRNIGAVIPVGLKK